jgi:hypothetical protein
MGQYTVLPEWRVNGQTYLASNEWLTPPWMLTLLGPFDLDPCAAEKRPWDVAKINFTSTDDGLSKPWFGRVWLNPPFGKGLDQWMSRLAQHGNGLGILPVRSTDTAWFHQAIWQGADAVMFLRSRLRFYTIDGHEGGPCPHATLIVAYGEPNVDRLARARTESDRTLFRGGRLLHLWNLAS